jgi:hypothetical protein
VATFARPATSNPSTPTILFSPSSQGQRTRYPLFVGYWEAVCVRTGKALCSPPAGAGGFDRPGFAHSDATAERCPAMVEPVIDRVALLRDGGIWA